MHTLIFRIMIRFILGRRSMLVKFGRMHMHGLFVFGWFEDIYIRPKLTSCPLYGRMYIYINLLTCNFGYGLSIATEHHPVTPCKLHASQICKKKFRERSACKLKALQVNTDKWINC